MKNKYVWAFTALMVTYIALAFSLPTDPEILSKHNITQNQARFLNLTIVVPLSIVYFAALYGFLRFKSYADSISDSKEGGPMHQLATGLAVLAFSLPINSILGSLVNYIELDHSSLEAAATITRSYTNLLLALIAFTYIAVGAKNLLDTLKNKQVKPRPYITLLGPIFLATVFTWLITTQPHDSGNEATYFMPSWLVVFTLAIPYVYIWCKGIEASHKLRLYKDRVKGHIYKRAIDQLAKGIAVIVILSIFLQMITALSAQLNRLELGPLLLVVYVLVILYALGYGLVARGAKKLKQIEEA